MREASYPFFIQWHLTESCNLRCRHCYQQSPVGEMSFKEICSAIDGLAGTIQYWVTHYQMDVSPSIHFTGGEPLLRRELLDILNYARQAGFATSLLSNGTLITRAMARQLKQASVEDVQVSLDGMEEVHDSIRGRGSFQKALAGIANLVAEGLDANINMTVSSLNYRELDPLLAFTETLGVSALGFARLVPCGRGKELTENVLNPQQLAGLSAKLLEVREGSRVTLISRDPLIGVANVTDEAAIPRSDFPIGGCSAGIFGVTITADGSIMPCRRMDLSIGNIKTDDFRQLWVESPALIALRSREAYQGACRTCLYWANCRGCRAIALAGARAAGVEDYLGPDPQCVYYRPDREYVEETK